MEHQENQGFNTGVTAETSPETRTTGSEDQLAASLCSSCARDHREGFNYANLDPGIVVAVRILREGGVDTVWSCEGGPGHAYKEPIIVFRGDAAEARRVIEIARREHLAPVKITRCWYLWRTYGDRDERPTIERINANGLSGHWQIEFAHPFRHDSSIAQHDIDKRQGHDANQSEHAQRQAEREQLFHRLVEQDPRLMRLWEEVIAGVIGLDDVWLTYFSYRLESIVGPERQGPGHESLFTEDAFEASLCSLASHQAQIIRLKRDDWGEYR